MFRGHFITLDVHCSRYCFLDEYLVCISWGADKIIYEVLIKLDSGLVPQTNLTIFIHYIQAGLPLRCITKPADDSRFHFFAHWHGNNNDSLIL